MLIIIIVVTTTTTTTSTTTTTTTTIGAGLLYADAVDVLGLPRPLHKHLRVRV